MRTISNAQTGSIKKKPEANSWAHAMLTHKCDSSFGFSPPRNNQNWLVNLWLFGEKTPHTLSPTQSLLFTDEFWRRGPRIGDFDGRSKRSIFTLHASVSFLFELVLAQKVSHPEENSISWANKSSADANARGGAGLIRSCESMRKGAATCWATPNKPRSLWQAIRSPPTLQALSGPTIRKISLAQPWSNTFWGLVPIDGPFLSTHATSFKFMHAPNDDRFDLIRPMLIFVGRRF